MWPSPDAAVWHWAHLVLKILAPAGRQQRQQARRRRQVGPGQRRWRQRAAAVPACRPARCAVATPEAQPLRGGRAGAGTRGEGKGWRVRALHAPSQGGCWPRCSAHGCISMPAAAWHRWLLLGARHQSPPPAQQPGGAPHPWRRRQRVPAGQMGSMRGQQGSVRAPGRGAALGSGLCGSQAGHTSAKVAIVCHSSREVGWGEDRLGVLAAHPSSTIGPCGDCAVLTRAHCSNPSAVSTSCRAQWWLAARLQGAPPRRRLQAGETACARGEMHSCLCSKGGNAVFGETWHEMENASECAASDRRGVLDARPPPTAALSAWCHPVGCHSLQRTAASRCAFQQTRAVMLWAASCNALHNNQQAEALAA